ncbi:MAG: bifunctional UDP-N-acetylglucosamine diphosphorylase/glucosamine-1-phosphate N-acetyltransferase GlmU [Desulfuromonadales bacterium]|nr:bifunctional UDP-N-acetylglucosamine diphosphorylase/glucosamine-1-phosphate N-acetyltransferase GlmU [Desulfuromonadales bacterium]
MQKPLACVILAAGQGTRMKSALPKVLHPLCGRPMLGHVIATAKELDCDPIVPVIGHGAEQIRRQFAGEALRFALQAEQLGTGHALLCTEGELRDFCGDLLLLCGDVPLLRTETLRSLHDEHVNSGATVSVLTARLVNPFGYGRIVRGPQGVERIVEEKDATAAEKRLQEINTGIYLLRAPHVFDLLRSVRNDNAQGEYYLTDIIAAARAAGERVTAHQVDAAAEAMGINDRVQLAEATRLLRARLNRQHMENGVTLIDPAATYIDAGVTIAADSVIHPGVQIGGETRIGGACLLESGVTIRDSVIGERVHLKAGSVVSESHIGDDCAIGPMAHLRPGTELAGQNKLGNFVETKKATLGERSQASHLTYLGDATIGRNVNIGCGTITCNYDGVNKHRTVIEDDVFVGSDTQFVAPLTVGRGSLIGAGSTITRDVPADALAIARSEQKNVEGWAARKREKTCKE